jgi:hypothetical protein
MVAVVAVDRRAHRSRQISVVAEQATVRPPAQLQQQAQQTKVAVVAAATYQHLMARLAALVASSSSIGHRRLTWHTLQKSKTE